MLKVLKAFVYLMALVGFGAVGYLVYLGAMKAKSDLLPGGAPVATATVPAPGNAPAGVAAAPAPAPTPEVKMPTDPAMASIVQSYQKEIAPQSADAGTSGSASALVAKMKAKQPVRTPGPETLVISKWPTGRKLVALTYDDGPHPEHTLKLLDLLSAKGVKATFFILGPNVEKNPEIAQAIVQSGHEIGNHTMTHPQFHGLAEDKVRTEITRTSEIVKDITGVTPAVMRPPYGQHPKKVEDVVRELNMKIIRWSVDTEDWKSAPVERMKKLIMDGLTDGAIILMHDTKGEKVYAVTEQVIDEIRAKGYEFVTVSEMLGGKAPAVAPAAAAASAPVAAAAPESPKAPLAGVTPKAAQPAAAGTAGPDSASLPRPADAAVPPAERKMPEVSPEKLTTAQ